jgi:hypothetical protein
MRDGLPGHSNEDKIEEPILITEAEWDDAEDSCLEALNDLNEWEDNNERLDQMIEETEDLNEINEFDSN